jgi:hypothetical protein
MLKKQMSFMLFCSLIAGSAVAQDGNSRLQISMSKPVGLMVDGQMQEMQDQSLTYIVDNLTEGRHEISLRSMFGKELDNLFVDVPAHSEVRCRYRKKIFECYDTVALAPIVETVIVEPALAVAHAPAHTEVVETTTTTTTTESLGGMPGGMLAGGITMAGPAGESISVGVNIGGLGHGVAMGGTFTETTTVTTTNEPVHEVHEPVRVAPSHVTLVLRSTDGEWADFVVNGKVVAEFRNEEEIKVKVKPGHHTIEVREFMKDSGYTRAKIDTGYADEVVVGITEGQPIECYNHNGCY